MKRLFKYGVLPVVTFVFLLIATVIALPVVINFQKFLPQIETKLSNVTGRTVSIGSNFALTFFPYLSVSFSDLKVDNPDGYLSNGFMKIESFEARVRLLPLLRKKVEISRFIIGGLEVNLEKKSDGRANWDFRQKGNAGEKITSPPSHWVNWSAPEDLSIALFAITDGTVLWADRTQHLDYRIEDLMLLFNNFTLDNPVGVEFKGTFGGKSLAAEGKMGPLGPNPGMGVLPVDLAVSLINSFSGQVKGKFINLLENPSYDLELHIPPFSARELFASLNIDFPYVTGDPTTYLSVGIDATAKGDKDNVSIENGKIIVDDTLLDISLAVKKFNNPDLGFTLNIDRLDLGRYLPLEATTTNNPESLGQSEQGATADSGWQKMNMAGTIQVKELRVGGGIINDISGNMRGADGIFMVDSSSFVLYQGRAQATLTVDMQKEIAETSIELKAQAVQVGPLLHDFMAKDFLSGSVDTDIYSQFSGNSLDRISKSLVAEGFLTLKNGVLEGIDLVNGLKNIVDLSSDLDSSAQKIRTEFSELKSIFTIRNGLVDSRETTIMSPISSTLVSGTADLVSKELKLMIKPKTVILKTVGLGDEKESSNGLVPFALSGTFAQPKIEIDGQYVSLADLKLSDEGEIQSLVDEKIPSPVDEDVRDLVGTTLIDPAVVAQRFGLQPKLIQRDQAKKQLILGTGRIRVSSLQEEDVWH